MLPNAFIGKPEKPTEDELSAALGPGKAVWDQFLADLAADFDVPIQEWHSYSPKAGWALRVKRGKRTILYLSPCQGCFLASFALGDRAVAAARRSRLSRQVLKNLDEAKRYAEGTALRIEVHGPQDIATIKKLATVKLEN